MATLFPGIVAHDAPIANESSLSETVDLGGRVPVSIEIPSNWTTDADRISFQVSIDNGVTFHPFYRADGTEYVIDNIVPGMIISLPRIDLEGATHLKVQSGTHGSPTDQADSDKLILIGSRSLEITVGETEPTIASFINAIHDHENPAGGGTLSTDAVTSGTWSVARGGTGAGTLTGIILGNGASAMTGITGASGQLIRHNGTNWIADVLVAGDIPSIPASNIGSGQLAVARGGTGAGTLTGIILGNGASAMTGITGASGQLIRHNGTNWIADVLVAGDIPSIPASNIGSGQLAVARGGTGADLTSTGGTNQFLRQSAVGGAITVSALLDADLAVAPVLAPGSSTRNVIQPSGDYIPLTIKGYSSQTAKAFSYKNNSNTELLFIDKSGNLGVGSGLGTAQGMIHVWGPLASVMGYYGQHQDTVSTAVGITPLPMWITHNTAITNSGGSTVSKGFATSVTVTGSTGTAQLYGAYFQAYNNSSGGAKTLAGVVARSGNYGNSQTTAAAYGILAGIDSVGPSTITSYYDYYAGVTGNYGTTAVGSRYAFYASNINPGSGTLTNQYGVYIESMVGGGTLNYALYSAGGQSYHAGNFGIGATTPGAKLEVKDTDSGTNTAITLVSLTRTSSGSPIATGFGGTLDFKLQDLGSGGGISTYAKFGARVIKFGATSGAEFYGEVLDGTSQGVLAIGSAGVLIGFGNTQWSPSGIGNGLVAIGNNIGNGGSPTFSVLIGRSAGKISTANTTPSSAVLIGASAGQNSNISSGVGIGTNVQVNTTFASVSASYVAVGNSAIAAIRSVAIGDSAQATNQDSTVVGFGALGDDHAVVIGSNNNGSTGKTTGYGGIAIGKNSKVTANFGIALGPELTVATANVAAIGGTDSTYIVKVGVGTVTPATRLHISDLSALTNSVQINSTLGHNTSGTPAAGFGTGIELCLQSNTTVNRQAAQLVALWNDPADGTRKADFVAYAYDTAQREIWRGRGSGSAAMIGFLGAAPAIRQTGGVATAGAIYTATEQAMIQKAYDTLRTFGFLD